MVRDFMRFHLFNTNGASHPGVDLEDPVVIRNLSEPDVGKILYDSFKSAINALTIADTGVTRIESYILLQHTRPFRTADWPFLAAFTKNYLAIGFKFDYVKANGDLSNYIPDFIARDTNGTVWIIETKGREELDLPQKMSRLGQWCAAATAAEENGTRYDFVYVDQTSFEKHKPATLADLATSFTEYKA